MHTADVITRRDHTANLCFAQFEAVVAPNRVDLSACAKVLWSLIQCKEQRALSGMVAIPDF